MCGLAGAISFDPRRRLPPEVRRRVSRRLDADLAHRGPDGDGSLFLEQPDPPLAALLVHRRLAVLDPRPRSDQPFTSPDGRVAVVFNGEVFNFRQLRDELSPRDWRTEGDTEVLLAAYEAWGDRCCDRLEGMFAFAVVDVRDAAKPTVLLARDAAGEKPLFVAVAGHREEDDDADPLSPGASVPAFAFASELRPLRRAAALLRDEAGWDVDLSVDAAALQEYLAWGYVPGEATIHRGVTRVPPGHCVTLSPGRVARRRFFDAAGRFELAGPDRWRSAIGLTRQVVGTAVERRLVSDVPVGCLLSGGIDSSIVAREMARRVGRVETFAVGFDDDPRYDESRHARRVADFLGTRHHELRVSADSIDLAGDLPRLAASFGEPFGDSSAVPTRLVCEFARRHVTVALGGDGGDESFGGYDRYRALAMTQRLSTSGLAGPASSVGRLLRRRAGHPKGRLARLARLLATADRPAAERYGGYVGLMTPEEVRWLLPAGAVASRPPAGRVAGRWFGPHLHAGGGGGGLASAAAALDRATYLPGDLLVKLDRCSMRHGLEVRAPFVDRDVLRLAGTLGDAGLIVRGGRGRGKALLRDAFGHALPPEVFARRKMGFAVPIAEWLRGPRLGPMASDLLLAPDGFCAARLDPTAVRLLHDRHRAGAADHGAKLYALLMLELWWRDARGDL